QEVSMWRNGKGAPNAYYCSKLADLIGEDPQTVIAIVGANWEKNPERKAYWLEKLTGTAASIILLSSLLTLPSPADASAMEKPSKTVKNHIYIMLNIETRRRSDNSYIQKHSSNHPLSTR
ncbi:MAG: hypothetical protein ABW149_06855, partial [Sedimenticola sp.]